MMSSGKRKRDEYPDQLPSGSFVPQQDGCADQVAEFVGSKVLFKILYNFFPLYYYERVGWIVDDRGTVLFVLL